MVQHDVTLEAMTEQPKPTDGSAGESPVSSAMTIARLLLLVKENQLATAVILFAAWQAGVFVEAWMTIQGICAA